MALKVSVSPQKKLKTSINQVQLININLEELKNVDTESYGLSNGFVLIYNADTQKWVTKYIEGFGEVDGGEY